MTVTIRPALTEHDVAFIARHFQETIALWEDHQVTSGSLERQAKAIQEWITSEGMHVTVAETAQGELVGFNSLHLTRAFDGEEIGKIIILFVRPANREQGIARALKDEGEAWLRERGIRKVETEIDAKNERMLQINEQAGFRIRSHTLVKSL